jgi:hypothetical protein
MWGEQFRSSLFIMIFLTLYIHLLVIASVPFFPKLNILNWSLGEDGWH